MAPTVDSPRSPQKSSQSMLGALLSTAASALKSPPYNVSGSEGATRSLDPAHEDVYTRNLLFPDQNTTYRFQDPVYSFLADPSVQGQAVVGGASDGLGRMDLQNPRDIRILIAQGSTMSHPKVVLFDSNATPLPSTSQPRRPNGYLDRSSPPSPSRVMPGLQVQRREEPWDAPAFNDPPSILSGAFERSKRRDLHMLQMADTNEKGLANEPVADLRLVLDCMFGHTPLSYRGDTTKLHVFPNDEKANARPSHTSPVAKEGSGSWGRAEGRRKSQLSRSFTPSDLSTGDLSILPTSNPTAKGSDKRTVLLTRTFSVSLPDVIKASREENEKDKDDGQRRAPMYGVALILQIPVSTQTQTVSDLDSGSRAGSLGNREPYSSSYEHETRSGWLFLDPASGLTSSSASSIYSSDVDDFVDVITQRFDLVTRALSAIQSAVTPKLRTLLQQTTVSFSQQQLPPLHTMQARYLDEQRGLPGGSERLPARPIKYRLVLLSAGALMADNDVRRVAENTSKRFATGLRIPRVVTGQGRWGTWRDEARWIERWGGRKEQNFFFFQLLTAFLGNHTEWLNAIGPGWYRRRHEQLQTAGLGDDCAITSRTVIVGNNKLAARRLVFLLTSFLPATSASLDGPNFGGGGRPSSSASNRIPTTTVSPSRRGSLRRTLNQRAGLRRGDSGSLETGEGESVPVHRGENMLISVESPSSAGSTEMQSVKTASLPIPQSNASTRKSSATTIATIIPATTTPPFASHRAGQSFGPNSEAPNSIGSLASLNLIHTLQRNDSPEHSHVSSDSQSVSRWGSLISGFWSNRRDSTDDSDYMIPPEEVHTVTSVRQRRHSRRQSGGKLAQLVKRSEQQDDTEHLSPTSHLPPHHGSLEHGETASGTHEPSSRGIPQRANVPDSPLKLSVDEKDGVVDVEVPLASFFSSSFGSPGHSPATSGFMSAGSFEEASSGHSHFSASPYQKFDVSTPVNVAGWLKRYHPDFALQAVSRYPQLDGDIKQSMRGEPTPAHSFIVRIDEKTKEQWVNVCSTLIADTERFTVKRLRLFRRSKPLSEARLRSSGEPDCPGKSLPSSDSGRLGHQSTTSDTEADEYFTEEPVFDIDNTLIDAVEHIMAQSSNTNHPPSAAASRPASRQRSRANTAVSTVARLEDVVPKEECERIVLGALDQVARSVMIERNRDEGGHTAQSASEIAATPGSRTQGTESSLREGVRKWLYDIEVVR